MIQENVYNMEIEELWNVYKTLLEEEDEKGTPLKAKYEIETSQIQNGHTIKIPIWYFTKKWYEEYPSSGKIKVLKYGKYQIKDFMQEKEKREQIMRTIIIENTDEGGITTPRN